MPNPVRYLDPEAETCPPFREGEAGVVWLDGDGVLETDTRVRISPNSYHSLFAHGVIDRLAKLPLLLPDLGPPGEERQAVISPAAMPDALRIFYDADRETYGVRHDLLVAEAFGEPPADYRVAVDNREYQRTLSQLQFLANQASRMGHGLRLQL